jgi:hypothetical protein
MDDSNDRQHLSVIRNKEDIKRNEKNIFSLKTKKKHLANFNYLYDILNKKYQDTYALKRYYVFAEDLVCKVEAESAAVVPEESQKIILRLSSSNILTKIISLIARA